jgi:hypothetical protein
MADTDTALGTLRADGAVCPGAGTRVTIDTLDVSRAGSDASMRPAVWSK